MLVCIVKKTKSILMKRRGIYIFQKDKKIFGLFVGMTFGFMTVPRYTPDVQLVF